MVRVSKYKLEPSHLEKLYLQLSKTIGKLDKKGAYTFLDELLGEEEKIVLAKRFAAIVMLIEKNSTYRISQLLFISDSTARTLKTKFNNGEFQYIEKMFTTNKKEYKEFWETLEVILCAGLPPRDKGRWKSINKMLHNEHQTQ